MKNNRFIKNTFYLMIGGIITRLMAMIIRIILTREVGTDGLGIYMLILPTFSLCITIANLGMPIALSKLVSENKKNNKKLVLSLVPVIIIFNIILMFIIILIAPILSNLLNNNKTFYPIIAIGLTLPFISITDVLRGYFFGKQKILPYILSNNIEQLIRLILIIFMIPHLLTFNLEYTITGVVLINIISESISIIILLLFAPKDIKIHISDFKYNKEYLKESLDIGIPSTSARLIGTLGNFLEPIILTFTMLLVGYTSNSITMEYAVVTGYVIPMLLMPSFFSGAISNTLLPVISKNYILGNYDYIKNKIKQAIGISLLIGIPITLIFIFIPELSLNLLYKTTLGSNYLRVIAPFFLLHYVQAPLTSTLQGINKAKTAMFGTLFGIIIKTILLFSLSLLKINMWGLIISMIVNILFVTFHHLYYVKKYLKKTNNIRNY